ncbi:MAG: tetratricopeptide repeat protein [Proteobacteria bacterium]|nr:tetratricopeptide repeat protein [Pseudomonadota bacterium]
MISTKTLNRIITAVTLLLLFSTVTYADTSTATLEKANQSYEEKNYSDAITQYNRAIELGADNGHVYYNLGNSYYKLGEYGKAIYAYRKALSDIPSDPDLLKNLETAREKTSDRIDYSTEKSILKMLLNKPLSMVSSFAKEDLKHHAVIIFAIGCFLFIAYIITIIKLIKYVVYFFIIAFSLIFASSYFSKQGIDSILEFNFSPTSIGVISAKEVKVFAGDSDTYQVITTLHDGAEVKIREQREKWVEVLLPNERKGWIQKDKIDIVD